MSVDEARFRQALGHFASGVTVITTEHEGRQYGATASSFSSLSLRPPLVLVCLGISTVSHSAVLAAGSFVVNILEKSQEYVSRQFASNADDKFKGIAWSAGVLGLPVLNDALATIECRLQTTLPGGDHTIFVGEVVHADIGEGSPLLYYRRGYHELA